MQKISKKDQHTFAHLDTLCRQLTPHLAGSITATKKFMLTGQASDIEVIKSLYNDIQQAHPEAGKSYWLTRTWELLFWQPVYISMVCIYELQNIIDFSTFAQHKNGPYIMGYSYQSVHFKQGESKVLIDCAGQQINRLLSHYQVLLDDWQRCRIGFSKQLLADFILASLLKLGQLKPEFSAQDIKRNAQLWLTALQLPLKNLASYSMTEDDKLHFIRRSCCMVYKTSHGELCHDCPRLAPKKRKRERICTS